MGAPCSNTLLDIPLVGSQLDGDDGILLQVFSPLQQIQGSVVHTDCGGDSDYIRKMMTVTIRDF